MASLEGFLDELIAVIAATSGIRYAPSDPPSQIAADPAAIVWLSEGRVIGGPDSVVEYHYTVRVALVTSMQNIAIANQRILPKIETVIEAVWDTLRSDQFRGNVANLGGSDGAFVTFTYGPILWGDVWFFGALIDIEDVKIQRRS